MDNAFATMRLRSDLKFMAAEYQREWSALLEWAGVHIPIDPAYGVAPHLNDDVWTVYGSSKPEPVWITSYGREVLIELMSSESRRLAARYYERTQERYLDLGKWLRRNARAYHILLEKG